MSAQLLDLPRTPSTRRRTTRLAAGSIALVLALVLGACGDDGESGSGSNGALDGLPEVAESEYEDMTGQDAVEIDVRDNSFGPQYVTVSPGTEITFTNNGRNPHNALPVEEGAFDDVPVDELQPDDQAARTFDEAGDYPYYCSLHGTQSRGMVGRIRVAEG
jgi:plastocyanin